MNADPKMERNIPAFVQKQSNVNGTTEARICLVPFSYSSIFISGFV